MRVTTAGGIVGSVFAAIAYWLVMALVGGYLLSEYGEFELGSIPDLVFAFMCFWPFGLLVSIVLGAKIGIRLARATHLSECDA